MNNHAKLYSAEPIEFTTFEDLSKYRQNQFIKFKCSNCGEYTLKYRVNIKEPLLCRRCLTIQTCRNIDWSERNNKSQKTKLERYGNPYYTNPDKIHETLNSKSDEEKQQIYDKVRKTNELKYNGHPACRQEQKDKTRQTCLEKYGVNAPAQLQDVKEKYKLTCKDKYGVENTFQVEEYKEKSRQTCLEKYGVENVMQSEEIQEKSRQTCLEKYGVDHVWKSEEVRKKCQNTCVEKYGTEYPGSIYSISHYLYNDILFDSSWELYYYIYLTDNNIEFEYHPAETFSYNGHVYYPDFKIGNTYYEIKGDQFFDSDDKMINPYDRSKDDLFEAKHQCMLKNNVIILRQKDLSDVFDYVNKKYGSDYIKQFKK